MKKIVIQKYSLISADLFAVFLSYVLSTFICNYLRGDNFHHVNLTHLSIIKIVNLIFMVILFWQKQLYFKRRPNWEEIRIISKLLLVMLLVNLPILFIRNGEGLTNSRLFIIFWLLLFVAVPIFRSICKLFLDNVGVWRRELFIVGVNENAFNGYKMLSESNLLGYRVKGFVDSRYPHSEIKINDRVIPVLKLDELYQQSNSAEILICLEERRLPNHVKLINRLQQKFLSVMILPQIEGLPLYGMEVNHFFGSEQLLLRLENNLSSRFNRVVKLLFDYTMALLILPFFVIVIAVVSLLIFLEDRGTPFFVQPRIGKDGKLFHCIKFRTMHKNAEKMLATWRDHQDPLYLEYVANNYKLINDPRVTRIGKFLRRTSLDELPQIINVLLATMSFVGPRPLLPDEVDEYPDGMFYYSQVRPGITGLWQISGRSRTSFKERGRLDGWYIKNWSLWYDIVITIKTIQVVLLRDGAY